MHNLFIMNENEIELTNKWNKNSFSFSISLSHIFFLMARNFAWELSTLFTEWINNEC
jgi:hypothetical protein